MRVPLSWLADFVDHGVDPRDARAVRELTDILDSLGLVVEHVEPVETLDGVVLAQVGEIRPIKGADRIRQVIVDAGPKGSSLEIVCGAWNFAVGDVVALATLGTRLPGGTVIAKRKLRGAVSEGMLCSARELELGKDGEGILVLGSATSGIARATDASPTPGAADTAEAKGAASAGGARLGVGPLHDVGSLLGRPLAEHLGIVADVVLDIAVEPNRPDCLSIAGIGRDLAARLRRPFRLPEPKLAVAGLAAKDLATVSVDSPRLCSSLAAGVLTGVTVVASPPEIARRLQLAGMRPINAVVDASNYVMLELGRPTHPYDLDQLAGSGLLARAARPLERLKTLDGIERTLGRSFGPTGQVVDVEDCLICDAEDHPVGLGGVMGGASSEISSSTTRILLEVALFDPGAVTRTAKRQGLRTEASTRFERGVDPGTTALVAERFAQLVVDAARYAGVEPPVVAPGVVSAGTAPAGPLQVKLRIDRLNALLGTALVEADVEELLAPIGFRVVLPAGQGQDDRSAGVLTAGPGPGGPGPGGPGPGGPGPGGPGPGGPGLGGPGPRGPGPGGPATGVVLGIEIPTYRPDVREEVDVIEEVARHYGYERISKRARRSPRVGRLEPGQRERRELRRLLCSLSAHEVCTSPIVDPSSHATLGEEHLLRLVNPMASEESALRAHLLPGLLAVARHNVSHRNGDLRIFELGHVFALAGAGVDGGAARDTDLSALDPAGSDPLQAVVDPPHGRAGPSQDSPASGSPAPLGSAPPAAIQGSSPPTAVVAEREHVAVLLAGDGDDARAAVSCWRFVAEQLRLAPNGFRLARFEGQGIALAPGQGSVASQLLTYGAHPTRSMLVIASPGRAEAIVGIVGEVSPALLETYGLGARRSGFVAFDVDRLLGLARRTTLAHLVSPYPSSDVDLAFVLPEEHLASALESELIQAAGERCEWVRLVDVYRGPSVVAGSRGLTFRLRFCAPDHTMGDEELAELRRACILAAEQHLPARLRS